VKEPVITDSTCLIGLEKIGCLDILHKIYTPVIIPPEVEKEFGISADWLEVEYPNQMLAASLKLITDDGEAEAIALALMKGYRIILDDRQARNIAMRLKLRVIGTLGILVQAKNSGIITLLNPLMEELERNNFFISDSLKKEALYLVGE